MRIIITGGGTGGHIYPALAIAKGLQIKFDKADILYVGTGKGLEADIVPKAQLPFQTIDVEGFSRPLSYLTLLQVLKAAKGSFEGWGILRRYQPDVVIGTGGYVCGPLVLAAATMGIPTLIHEQNAFPGLTNRILARFVTHVCVTFEDSLKHFSRKKGISLTGLPVRQEIILAKRLSALKNLGLSEKKLTVVVTGGSRGAKSLNYAMEAIYQKLQGEKKVQFYHITGQAGYQESLSFFQEKGLGISQSSQIKIVPYLYQMEDALAAADIIIGRAGASFLSEVMIQGLPSILIPYPHAAANHQEHNARSMENRGAAKVILDQDLAKGKLLPVLETIIENEQLRSQMGAAAHQMGKANALDDIIKIIVGISKSKQR